MNNKYGVEIQELLITMMISEPELYTRCSNILKPSYFDKKYSPVIAFINDYAEKHNGLPKPEFINAKYGSDFTHMADINISHKDWFFDTIEDLCKSRAISAAILKGAELIEGGDYGGVETMVKDAMLVSLQRDMGMSYFEDPRGRLERLKLQNGNISTGWKTIDEVVYQIGYGELVLFSAISGGGKSVAMQNMALNFALHGMNVIYITLELSPELVAKRLDAMLTGIPNNQIFTRLDEVELQVKRAGKKSGDISIKYMDPGSTPNDLKAYIREYTIQKGAKPDALVIDYLDLMHPNQKRIDMTNLFAKDKLVAEGVRALASPNNFNLVCVSAVQTNRSGYDESVPGMDSIAGGISKAYTADLMINIHNTTTLRQRGEIEFQMMKTRNSGGVGTVVTLGYDTDTLRIVDMEQPAEGSGATETPKNDVKSLLEKMKRV